MDPKIKESNWSKDFEPEIYNNWKTNAVYKFKKSKKPVYSIDTPPPYVNRPVHIAQVTTYCIMDMFARFRRMSGYEVLFPLGLDRNGLPIEMSAEKEFNVKLTDIPRKKALKFCEKLLEKYSMESVTSFLKCGISFNSWKIGKKIGEVYETDSKTYRALTQQTFIEMWKKGLIYEADRVNNFCPGCQTTIADSEIDYEEKQTLFSDIIFRVKETGEEIVIGTTRPEFLCTCAMIIYNPADERYKKLEGKHAVVPVFGREVPIKAHTQAKMEKGTGLVMMCAFGDYTDIRFFREQNLQPVIAVNKDGLLNEYAGLLKGLKVKDGRKKILDVLKEKGLIVQQRQITHQTPICERSKDDIEFISMKEFYVKQVEFKETVKELAKQVNFYAPESRQILFDWIESVSIDWPISRRRFYATEVPLWYCQQCNEPIVPEPGKYYQPWKQTCPVKSCPKCNGSKFIGDTRVFDTWFDSSISPLAILHYDKNKVFFEKNLPCTLRPQGKEIIRTWLYYTLLKCYHLTNKCIFKDVWINYHILDEKGRKMSKSLGNIIDPKEILDRYGAEPFRLWAALEGNLMKSDFMYSYDRTEGASKTLTKLWNVARFISLMPESSGKKSLLKTDEWILHELNHVIQFTKAGYEAYDFHNPAVKLKHFLWETFASHYLELVKSRAYNTEGKFSAEEQQGAVFTLNYCLEVLLRLLAPIIPMITYKLYETLHKKDIHKEKFPEPGNELHIPFTSEELTNVNSIIWKAKKDKGLSLKAEIKELILPEKFKAIEKDFLITHNVKSLLYGEEFNITL